jgi:hypothetical protein
MKMNRRQATVLIASPLIAGCTNYGTPTSPSSTTPLITALRRDGYTVVEEKNPNGGVALLINGKLQQIKVGATFIGIDPDMGMDPTKSGPPNLNIGQYEISDDEGYVLIV